MACSAKPEVIGKQCTELYPKQAALCEHTAMLFQAVAEIGLQSVIHDDQCFPEESAVLYIYDTVGNILDDPAYSIHEVKKRLSKSLLIGLIVGLIIIIPLMYISYKILGQTYKKKEGK